MKNDGTLRVGFLSPGWPLSSCPNGIVAYVENIIEGLNSLNAGVESIVLTSDLQEAADERFVIDLEQYNSRLANLPYKLFTKALSKANVQDAELVEYKQFIREYSSKLHAAIQALHQSLDIVEVEESFGLVYYAVNRSKTKYVTRLHGPWFTMKDIFHLEENNQYQSRVFFEGELIKKSHGITSPSQDVLDKVREYYDIELPDAAVIPNPAPEVAKENRWQLSEQGAYLLFVGRFDSHKGGDLVIKSFNIIAQSDKTIELHMVGPDRGFQVNGVQLNVNQYIEQNIKDASIRQRIKFHGHCGAAQIASLRQKARVTIFCSRYENHPVSLLEALATGCPTVATAVGGIKEIIVDEYNGLFAEPESPESIAEKTLILLGDSKKSSLLSKNAIKDTQKRFNPQDLAKDSLDYYKSLLGQ